MALYTEELSPSHGKAKNYQQYYNPEKSFLIIQALTKMSKLPSKDYSLAFKGCFFKFPTEEDKKLVADFVLKCTH